MHAGQSGKVVEIQGRSGLVDHLRVLGIRPGKRITKVSSMLMHGPVTVKVDRSYVAIGFGMADRIAIELKPGTREEYPNNKGKETINSVD